jgi:hypothetical protein
MAKRKVKKMKKKLQQAAVKFGYKHWTHSLAEIEKQLKEEGEFSIYGDLNRVYPIINEFDTIDSYDAYIEALIYATKKELSNSKDQLSKLTIAYKFNVDDDFQEMNFVRFLFNIIMWRPYIVSNIPVTKKDIFNAEVFHNKKYAEYFNNFADKYKDMFTMPEYSEILFDIQVYMNKIAVELGPLFGNSISIYDMVKMAKRNNEIESLMNTEVNLENFQVREVEEFLIRQTDRFFQILMNESDKNNPLKPLIRADVGVNKRQVQEIFLHLGFKPDLSGSTIPLTSNSNFTTYGLKDARALYVDAQGARKAAIMQLAVSESGYYGRHQSFVTSNVTLNEDPNYSCNTVNMLNVYIEAKEDLELFEGRFYKVGEKQYKIITSKDLHLIKKNIQVRSPETCANKDHKICKVCYGTLYNINYGMHAGLFAAIDSNENKTQKQLSARHALATISATIRLIDEKMFLINQNGWLFSLNDDIDRSKYSIVFNSSGVFMDNPENYEQADNYYVNRLIFKNIKTEEEFDVYEEQNTHLYLSKQLYKTLRDKKFFNLDVNETVEIPLKEFNIDEPFAFLRISNAELAKPLKELAGFIQKGKKQLEDVFDYHEFTAKLNKLYRYGGMAIPSVHIEMLLRNLIRRSDDELQIPDWEVEQTPDMYKMVSLNDSVILSDSVTLGLMFEKVRRQFKMPRTYKKRGSSIYSVLFINEQ